MKIKKICIITDRYPTKEYPINTFLDQLVCQFADMGIKCTVIAPYSPLRDKLNKRNYHPQKHWVKKTKNGATIDIFCPHMPPAFGMKIAGIDFTKIYGKLFVVAAEKEYKKNKVEADAFYAHFVIPAGLAAAELSAKFHIPYFVAYGESSIEIISSHIALDTVQRKLLDISGIIAVSTKNKQELVLNRVVTEEKVSVFPNAIDSGAFHLMDKNEVRKELGIPEACFIVAFVGHYIHRKGPQRVAAAIKGLPNINSFFIGDGEEKPDCAGILFTGRLPHDEIVKYLNAADIFVLPTLAEGCCNAIVEAMACGLPIVSSNLPFNDDILDDTNSIRIDPTNIDEIKSSIQLLRDDPVLRKKLASGANKKAEMLRIENRARNILEFMEERIGGTI